MKKFRITALLATLLAAVLLGSCDNREKIEYYEEGTLSLRIPVNIDLTNVVVKENGTKADPATPDVSNYTIKVTLLSNNSVAGQWKYSEMPEIVTLKTGKYRIEAYSHTLKDSEWENPYFYASQEFEVRKSAVTTINPLTCKLNSVKVSVEYSQTMLDELASFTVTVSNNKGFLEYGRQETRMGYFSPGSLTVTLDGMRHDATAVHDEKVIPNASGGEWHKIKMNVVLVGELQTQLKVDMSVVLIEHGVNVPTEEETIVDPDDPGTDPEPQPILAVKGRGGLNIKEPITYPVQSTRAVIVDITAERGIKDLWVEIDSPFLTEEMLGSLNPDIPIPKKFNLADLTPELKEVFGPGVLNLIGNDPVRGATNLTFDISTFTGLLDVNTHKFHLTVTDTDGQTVKETLTLQPY